MDNDLESTRLRTVTNIWPVPPCATPINHVS